MEVVDIVNIASLVSDCLGLECLLTGLSDLMWSDLRDTGDKDPSCAGLAESSLVRLEAADSPDISLVRLDTRAEVSDWEEFCLARLGISPTLAVALADALRLVLGD
jgi:hypothetical protein